MLVYSLVSALVFLYTLLHDDSRPPFRGPYWRTSVLPSVDSLPFSMQNTKRRHVHYGTPGFYCRLMQLKSCGAALYSMKYHAENGSASFMSTSPLQVAECHHLQKRNPPYRLQPLSETSLDR